MTPKEYLEKGKKLLDLGYPTDGCSFIGGLISDKYEPACWSHDFARQGLITSIDGQADNDNHFRMALRELGMSNWMSNLMYYFTRTQGWFQDKLNMRVNAFLGFIFFISVVIYSAYKAGVFQ